MSTNKVGDRNDATEIYVTQVRNVCAPREEREALFCLVPTPGGMRVWVGGIVTEDISDFGKTFGNGYGSRIMIEGVLVEVNYTTLILPEPGRSVEEMFMQRIPVLLGIFQSESESESSLLDKLSQQFPNEI